MVLTLVQQSLGFFKTMEKKIESSVEVKLYGVRIIIGTFDKHKPRDIYLDGTINLKGDTATKVNLESAKTELSKSLYQWLRSQDDYDKAKYIKKVEYPDTFRDQYKSKRTKLRFDMSLLPKQPRSWNETVEVAKGYIMDLYQRIVDVVLLNGLELLPFDGYNNKAK